MELRLCKRSDGLYEAYDNESLEIVIRMPTGQVLPVPYSAKRNYANLQRWHVFCKHSFEMQDSYDNLRVWKKILCIAAGHCDTVIDSNGNTQYLPSRVSYEECDDEGLFRDIFYKAVGWFLDKHGKGMTDKENARYCLMGIQGIGQTIADTLLDNRSLQDIANLSLDNLEKLIGGRLAKKIRNVFERK